MVNAWATVVQDWVPEATMDMVAHLNEFMYPDVKLGYDDTVDACFDISNGGSADNACLLDVAESTCFTPSTIGSIVGRQVAEYGKLLEKYHVNSLRDFRILELSFF